MIFIFLPIFLPIIIIILIILYIVLKKTNNKSKSLPPSIPKTFLSVLPSNSLFTNISNPTNIKKIKTNKIGYASYLLYLNNDGTLGVYGKAVYNIILENDMKFNDIEAGNDFFMGITIDNKLYINCSNDKTTIYKPSTEINNISKISAGYFHWLALDNDGVIYTMGPKNSQLTNDLITIPDILKSLLNLKGIPVKAIATNYSISAAVDINNNIYIWGDISKYPKSNNEKYIKIEPLFNKIVSNIVVNLLNLIALDENNKIILENNNIYGNINSLINMTLNDQDTYNNIIKNEPISYLTMNDSIVAFIINNKTYFRGNTRFINQTNLINNNIIDIAISDNIIFTLSTLNS